MAVEWRACFKVCSHYHIRAARVQLTHRPELQGLKLVCLRTSERYNVQARTHTLYLRTMPGPVRTASGSSEHSTGVSIHNYRDEMMSVIQFEIIGPVVNVAGLEIRKRVRLALGGRKWTCKPLTVHARVEDDN